jgi:hypothetical protein
VSTALQLEPSSPLLSVLLVETRKETRKKIFFIRDILERSRKIMPAELDNASSLEEAKTMLQRGHYGLVWFEHEMGAAATNLLAEFPLTGCTGAFHRARRTCR